MVWSWDLWYMVLSMLSASPVVFCRLYGLLGGAICWLMEDGCIGLTTLMLPWCSWTWNPDICGRPCCCCGVMTPGGATCGCCGCGWSTICCCWMRYWCISGGDVRGVVPPSHRNTAITVKIKSTIVGILTINHANNSWRSYNN